MIRTNSNSPGASFLEKQAAALARVKEKYATDRKLETDKLGEPILWAKDAEDAFSLARSFQSDAELQMDYFSDLTAYDNCDSVDGNFRFVVVLNLLSLKTLARVRIKVGLMLNQDIPTFSGIFPVANWFEREVFDMFGIRFRGHPNLRRIMMDERFTGHPLRKEYPMKQREPFPDNIRMHLGANPMKVDTTTTTQE